MSDKSILIVDDDSLVRAGIKGQLKKAGYVVSDAATAEDGLEAAIENHPDLVLLDIKIPVMGGEAVLKKLRVARPSLPVVILTGDYDAELVVRCMKNGALDFLTKPCDTERLLTTIRNVLQLSVLEDRLREVSSNEDSGNTIDMLYGRCAAMHRVFDQIRVLMQSDIGVLLEGPSGTGKELVARALHRKGPRQTGPFVAVNCGAIPESLLESELFGHERGAFTGAVSAHMGCFEQAHRGTLFLDEIGEMRADMQVRLLRVLESREVQRLGGAKKINVDVRVITATNRDLRERVAAGAFREDLYYRLAVYRLALPPLRERENDVLELAERFLLEFGNKLHKRGLELAPQTRRILRAYPWPGNVRQLRNAIERAVLVAQSDQVLPKDLPEELAGTIPAEESSQMLNAALMPASQSSAGLPAAPPSSRRLRATPTPESPYRNETEILSMEDEERRIFERALKICNGDVGEAATRLKIGRATLYRRVKELKLKPEE